MKMKKVDFEIPGMPEQREQRSPAELHVALGKIRADEFNSMQGNLVGHDCPKCKNKGAIASVRADGSMSVTSCSCSPVRVYLSRMEASGMRDVLQRFTFDTYQDVETWQKHLKQRVKEYAEEPKGWLLVCGQSGSGKTHLCKMIRCEGPKTGMGIRFDFSSHAHLIDYKGRYCRRSNYYTCELAQMLARKWDRTQL